MADKKSLTVVAEEVATDAWERLRGFLAVKEPTGAQINVARVATSAISAQARLVQSQGAHEALVVMAARDLATNKETHAEYLKRALPTASYVRRMLTD